MYYYDSTDQYQWGELLLGDPVPNPNPMDLCMRLSGQMNVIDLTYFGAYPYFPMGGETWGCSPHIWKERANEVGLHHARFRAAWTWVDSAPYGSWQFGMLDQQYLYLKDSLEKCEVYSNPYSCTKGTSTHYNKIEVTGDRVDTFWSIDCPPRGLFLPVNDPGNYWAGFMRKLVRQYDSLSYSLSCESIHTHEVWNEPNVLFEYWEVPNARDYAGLTSVRARCSIYVRLCEVAHAAITGLPGHASDRILVGSICDLENQQFGPGGDTLILKGKVWLRWMYEVARHPGGPGVFWDGVAFHYYRYFNPDSFEANAETLRAIMRQENGDFGELWITEVGWPTGEFWMSEPEQANAIAEVFTTALGSSARPGGGYDRTDWFCFRNTPSFHHGLADTLLENLKCSFYSLAQTGQSLTGLRLNGRVYTGDPWLDDITRTFEFEDIDGWRKTWVSWVNGGQERQNVRLPVRCNEMAAESLAYGETPSVFDADPGVDGWLELNLGERPVFVTEAGVTGRPDLAVDSVKCLTSNPALDAPVKLKAWLRNVGNVATSGSVAVGFEWNGIPLCAGTTNGPIPSQETSSVTLDGVTLPSGAGGWGLLSAEANPGQQYVEKDGLDDNVGYRRMYVHNMPRGQLDVFTGPFARSEVPLMLMHSTASWICDSMRLFQEAYSQDGELLSVDSTAWFPLTSGPTLDTCWTFLHGPSKYRILAQHKDTLGNSCAPFSSMQDTIVFDSVAPGCEVTVNDGERFVTQPQVSVQTTLLDSTDVPFEMRLGNLGIENIVANPTFTEQYSSWEFSDGGYGSGLEMGEVVLSQEHETWVRQVIPCGAFSVGHLGRQYRLSADLLGLAKNYWGQLGWQEFAYAYAHVDTSQHDTLLQYLASVQLNGPMEARVGLNRAFCDFILPEPNPDPNLVWQGGIVRLRCPTLPQGASGKAWLDNISISPFGQYPQTSWWQSFQPECYWQLDPLVTGEHTVSVAYRDNAGNETWPAFEDTVVLDMQPPIVFLQSPPAGYYLSDTASLAGWAFDWPSPAGDTYFLSYRLDFRYPDSTNWLPVDPDSVSYQSAPPDTTLGQGWFPRHLGYWNTTLVPDGPYLLRVVGTDSALNQSEHVSWAIVQNDTCTDDNTTTSASGTSIGPGSVYVGTATGKLLQYSEGLDSLGCITISDSLGDANITAMLSVGDDSVITADVKNLCIHKLRKNGQGKRRFANYPGLIAAAAKDDDGNIWAIDQSRSLLAKVRPNGTLAFTRGGQSADSIQRLKNPEGMAVRGELVYVSDTRNNRLVVWDTAGNFTRAIPLGFMPQAILVTDSGAIYTVNKTAGTIVGLNAQGEQFYRIEKRNSNPHKHLVLSDDQHYLFTYQPATKELLKYQIQSNESMPGGGQQSGGNANLPKELTLLPPRPNPSNGRVTISYALPKAGNFSLRIFDVTGRVVKTLVRGLGHNPAAGTYQCVWNHDDDRGRQLATGIYFVRLDAEDGSKVRKVVVER